MNQNMMDIFNSPEEVALRKHLFSTPNHHAYAIVDGAASPGLLSTFNQHPAEYRCLFLGELDPALAAAAPYLIKLKQYSHITEWLITSKGLNQHIFAVVPDNIEFNTLHTHFRGFLRIRSARNKMLYFRYYDPRVMQDFLPNCCPEQAQTLFGPIKEYLVEDAQEKMHRFWQENERVTQQPLVPLQTQNDQTSKAQARC